MSKIHNMTEDNIKPFNIGDDAIVRRDDMKPIFGKVTEIYYDPDTDEPWITIRNAVGEEFTEMYSETFHALSDITYSYCMFIWNRSNKYGFNEIVLLFA